MKRDLWRGLTLSLCAALIGLVSWRSVSGAEAGPGAQSSYPLWDGKETPVQYAQRAHIEKVTQDLELTKGVSLRVALIPAGTFKMGATDAEAEIARSLMHNGAGNPADELPQHQVTISRPFYMAIYPVTQEQYHALTGKVKEPPKGANARQTVLYWKAPRNPEVFSWDEANEFCSALSEKSGLKVRLPTEAEWEYACRAGTTTPFNTGMAISTDQANYDGNFVWDNGKKGQYRQKFTAVGSFKPNAWGLFDMHGNLSNWCSDWYARDYYNNSPATDPTGPADGQKRVVRNGTWATPPRNCRSACRDAVPPSTRGIGLRVVVEVK